MRQFCNLLVLIFCITNVNAQDKDYLQENSFSLEDLSSVEFIDLLKSRLAESQFMLLGEQHGIVEVGEISSLLFGLAQPHGFNTLCIETDAQAAKKIESLFESGNQLESFKKLEKEFPFSIPFYANYQDQLMFETILGAGGQLWGIDQTLMTQFRMNFNEIIQQTKNRSLKLKLTPLRDQAIRSFQKAINEKNYMAPYIFQYDESTHKELKALSTDPEEIEIFDQFWTTKEIYGYNFSGDYYLNNELRGQLMKRNFIKYYRAAQKKTPQPKVLFKLGANHAARGLTRTRIYDIANFASELAIFNDQRSLHFLVMGISGTQNRANPFDPENTTVQIEPSKMIPSEVLELAMASDEKYFVLDMEALRPVTKTLSKELKKLIFQYDVMVLVKEARALKGF